MTTYLFFTGGYDSTYRLCELAIIKKRVVQPIYISDPFIDNYKTKKTRRKNNLNEFNAQVKIVNKIVKKFPYTNKLIKPIINVDEQEYDAEISKAMKILSKKKYIRREKCQYGAMAQYCKNKRWNIEVCAEIGGNFEKKMGKYVVKDLNHNYIFDNPDLHIFRYFHLPLIKTNKTQMHNESKTFEFDDILQNSWSCWYPKKGKPCGRCIMCKERIVPFSEHFQIIINKKTINKKTINSIVLLLLILILFIILFRKFRVC